MRLPFVSRREHDRVVDLADRAIRNVHARNRHTHARLSEAVHLGLHLANEETTTAERQAARERLKELWF